MLCAKLNKPLDGNRKCFEVEFGIDIVDLRKKSLQ